MGPLGKGFLLTALFLATSAGHAGGLSQWEKNAIREQYQEAIFNRPATIRNRTSDQKMFESLTQQAPKIDRPRYAPLPDIPDVRVFANRELGFQTFITMLSKTIGYETPIFLHVPVSILEKPIIVNTEFHSLIHLVDWLEARTGARIAIYPDSKTIQVSEHQHGRFSTARHRE